MLYLTTVAAALSLIVPTPPVQQFVVPAAAPTFAAVAGPSANIFPTTELLGNAITSIDDELEKAAIAQAAQDAIIDARKAAIRQAQEAAEKKQADEFAAEQAKQAERKAKTDAAIAKSKAQAEERAAKVAAEKAEREAERAAKYGATGTATASKGESTKSSKDQVVRVSARAERIAARKAAGEDAPTLFGN